MENLPFHPHYDVWALIVSLVIFFELSTKDKTIKKDKRKLWYSGLLILWAFTDYPIHDIGERYLFLEKKNPATPDSVFSPIFFLLTSKI